MKKFSVEFVDADGIKSVWKYDLDVTTSGPISAEQLLPKDFKEINPSNESLPISKRMYLNEATGKLVGYTRARALGLI